MFTHNSSSRTCHGFVWLTPGLWLILEAWLTLDATFHLSVLRNLVAALHFPAHILSRLEWLKVTAWPFVSLIAVMVLRQEAMRWIKGHGACRLADRLTTAWFVFISTLYLVDYLTPAITVVWPIGAIQATVWLLLTRAASIVSRLLHATSRRKLRKYFRRWPIVTWLSTVAELLTLRLRKGVLPNVPSPHAHSNHRAR